MALIWLFAAPNSYNPILSITTRDINPLRSRVQMPILFGEYPLSERRHLFVRVSFFHYPILRFNYLLYILRE